MAAGLIYTTEHAVNPNIDDNFTALYFTLTTLTTVGFGDITPMTWGGKLVVSGSILAGITIIPAQAATLVEALLQRGEEEQRLEQQQQQLSTAILKPPAESMLQVLVGDETNGANRRPGNVLPARWACIGRTLPIATTVPVLYCSDRKTRQLWSCPINCRPNGCLSRLRCLPSLPSPTFLMTYGFDNTIDG